MEGAGDARDVGVVIVLLRELNRWSQTELAEVAGIGRRKMSSYETGKVAPSRQTLEKIAAAAGVPFAVIPQLVALVGALRKARVGQGLVEPGSSLGDEVRAVAEAVAQGTKPVVAAFLAEMELLSAPEKRRDDHPSPADREHGERLWARLQQNPEKNWPLLAAGAREYQNWALCERLCHESEKAAGSDASRALELANLAVLIAEVTSGPEPWRARLGGFAWAHAANARRVAGDLLAAEQSFARSRQLWQAGEEAPGLLDESRVLDLEASLCRAERRFDEALRLLDRARSASPDRAAEARLLLKRAFTLEQMGDFEAAISALREAAPMVDSRGELRDRCVLHFNLAVNFLHAGHHAEAEALLPQVRNLALQLGNGLDQVRVRWLEGRVAGALGRRAEAIAALEEVQAEFAARGIAYDVALSTLELAALYLEEGRTAEVRELAQQTAAALAAQGVARETLGALLLFFEAVEREAVDAQLVGTLLRRCKERQV